MVIPSGLLFYGGRVEVEMVKWGCGVVVGLMALVLVGCPKGAVQPSPDGTGQVPSEFVAAAVRVGVGGFATAGCMLIPSKDKASSLAALDAIDGVLKSNPATAIALIGNELQNNVAAAYLWSALHEAINMAQFELKTNVESSGAWMDLATGALKSAVAGCKAGLGVSPV